MTKGIIFKQDSNLTEHQKELKWSLYCEMETFETLEDIEAVLLSLLKDVKEQRGAPNV